MTDVSLSPSVRNASKSRHKGLTNGTPLPEGIVAEFAMRCLRTEDLRMFHRECRERLGLLAMISLRQRLITYSV